VEYADSILALRIDRPDLAEELAQFRGLANVMQWMAQRGVPLAAAEIIQQDEFSLDFVVPIDADGTHLAFGIT
jgi:hypothetical protein